MTQERSGPGLRGFACMDINKQREIARAVPTSLMKSEASHRIASLPPMRAGKGGVPWRQRRVVFRPTGVWHPKPAAKGVERRKGSAVDV